MEGVVHRYIRALNDADLDAIVALYAEDAEVQDPVGTPPHRGHAAIRAFYAGSVALGLKVSLEGPVRACADRAAFAFRVQLTWQGKSTTICPIDIFRFNDAGQIVQMQAIFGAANIAADSIPIDPAIKY
ncbi:MAG: nuclear transport factor 2 family protein [Proteobacteria bacterium]|nr:nuclear transport factor 2 family protein [Pseudomonadota bacterium]